MNISILIQCSYVAARSANADEFNSKTVQSSGPSDSENDSTALLRWKRPNVPCLYVPFLLAIVCRSPFQSITMSDMVRCVMRDDICDFPGAQTRRKVSRSPQSLVDNYLLILYRGVYGSGKFKWRRHSNSRDRHLGIYVLAHYA